MTRFYYEISIVLSLQLSAITLTALEFYAWRNSKFNFLISFLVTHLLKVELLSANERSVWAKRGNWIVKGWKAWMHSNGTKFVLNNELTENYKLKTVEMEILVSNPWPIKEIPYESWETKWRKN